MRRRIGLFVTITLMTLAIGLVGMLLYLEKLRAAADTPNDKVVVQFPTDFDIAQNRDMLSEAQTQAWELTQAETASPDTDIDRALYEEAVSSGQKAFIAECADKEQVTFAFAGDILFDESYTIMYQYVARGGSVEDTFLSGLSERMCAADVFMLNNEFPFSERGTPTEGKQFTFRANPKHVAVLEEMGVDLVSLANNHAYDYGNDALLDTFDVLDSAELPYVGAGETLTRRCSRFISLQTA